MASENPTGSITDAKEKDGVQKRPGGTVGETPSKRQKRRDKYQAFDPKEKDQLKKYENCETQTRKILDRTNKMFDNLSRDDMQKEIKYLKSRLDTFETKTSLDPIYIGFVGPTGAGKTSLLNAILGKKLFLPVSGSNVCTSCVVEVKASRAHKYEAVIHLLSDNEWKEELKNLVEVLSNNGNDEDDDSEDECARDAKEKLHALYGEGAEKMDYKTLLKTKFQVSIPTGRTISITAQEAEEFSQKLETYVRVRDKGTDNLSPLIEYVEVTIPQSEFLPEDIILLDIPGTGDFNRKRDEMWKQRINICSVIWIVSGLERIEGEKIQSMLVEESIKAFTGGVCTDIALVVTKSDNIDLEEYGRERKNKNIPIENEHDAILERNQKVKNKKEKQIKEKLQKKLPSDAEVLNKPKLVYTVSVREFWKPKHLSQEETEIPELRECLRMIFLKEKQKLVTDYVTEVWGIHRLAKNLGSKPQHEDLVFQQSGVEELIKKDISSLEKDLQKCFDEIQQPLREGVERATNSYNDIVKKLFKRDEGYRGYHKTLKAVFLKGGIYASKRFARIDLNENLAKPIYNKVDGIVGSIFRTQNATRSSLWSHLEKFKYEMKNKIHQTGKHNRLPSNNEKIEIFIQETNVILQKLEKLILQRKLSIYQSLSVSIQSDLQPHYKAASEVRGQGSYERMKTILMEGIENEVKNQMFEKAKLKMESKFKELKEVILKNLKEQISMVFNLVFLQQDWVPVHLADIENECGELKEIYNRLQNDD